MEVTKIVLLGMLAAVVYGIVQDQVTARVCVEYFTIGHPPIFATDSPTLLAFGWGVVATWWVGVPLGIAGALVSRLGSWPQFTARQLVRPILVLMVSMGWFSLLAGITGYFAARSSAVWLVEPLASRVPLAKHHLFLADLWAHLAAYASGVLGGANAPQAAEIIRVHLFKSMARAYDSPVTFPFTEENHVSVFPAYQVWRHAPLDQALFPKSTRSAPAT